MWLCSFSITKRGQLSSCISMWLIFVMMSVRVSLWRRNMGGRLALNSFSHAHTRTSHIRGLRFDLWRTPLTHYLTIEKFRVHSLCFESGCRQREPETQIFKKNNQLSSYSLFWNLFTIFLFISKRNGMNSIGPVCYREPSSFALLVAIALIVAIPLSYVPQVPRMPLTSLHTFYLFQMNSFVCVCMCALFVVVCIQYLKYISIIRSKSSEGISCLTLAVLLLGGLLTLINHSILQWDSILCCGLLVQRELRFSTFRIRIDTFHHQTNNNNNNNKMKQTKANKRSYHSNSYRSQKKCLECKTMYCK
jgi:hypothetical protein